MTRQGALVKRTRKKNETCRTKGGSFEPSNLCELRACNPECIAAEGNHSCMSTHPCYPWNKVLSTCTSTGVSDWDFKRKNKSPCRSAAGSHETTAHSRNAYLLPKQEIAALQFQHRCTLQGRRQELLEVPVLVLSTQKGRAQWRSCSDIFVKKKKKKKKKKKRN